MIDSLDSIGLLPFTLCKLIYLNIKSRKSNIKANIVYLRWNLPTNKLHQNVVFFQHKH